MNHRLIRESEMVAFIKGLSLTRKEREGTRIRVRGVEFFVYVGRIDGGRVGLVFDAPREVEILRTELIDQEPRSGAA